MSTPPKAPHPLPPGSEGSEGGQCPVDHSSRNTWTNLANGPLHNPHSSHPNVLPTTSGKGKDLSTEKEISSIPRGEHGAGNGEEKWIYPSEAQFYAALARKHQASSPSSPSITAPAPASHGEGDVEVDSSGKAVTNNHDVPLPQKRDMNVVVPIHNAVNERTWAKILEWESGRGGDICGGIRLLSFRGDSRKLSPRARWNILLGYQRPFDRHDWVVDRCGTKVRYVIDYYTGRVDKGNPFSFYIDARPALDSWEGVKMRMVSLWEG